MHISKYAWCHSRHTSTQTMSLTHTYLNPQIALAPTNALFPGICLTHFAKCSSILGCMHAYTCHVRMYVNSYRRVCVHCYLSTYIHIHIHCNSYPRAQTHTEDIHFDTNVNCARLKSAYIRTFIHIFEYKLVYIQYTYVNIHTTHTYTYMHPYIHTCQRDP